MADRCIGCNVKTMLHMLFLCVRCLVTCSSGINKRGWQQRKAKFLWCSSSIES
jgi:hypothetical protein